jgi:curved DNA-binding protein CbpA
METDLYDILQVAPHAEPEVIESAYKRLALKYHPDVNRAPDAHERMRALNHAYEILRNPAERELYDEKREAHAFARRRPTRRATPKKRAASKTKTRQHAKWNPPAKPKRETVQEAVAVNDALLADAVKLSKTYPTITSELLQKQLRIKYPRALNLYATLLEKGMIDDSGSWTLKTT